MKKGVTPVLITLCVSLSSLPAYAVDGLGLGIIVGEPTGVSIKHWVSDRRAIDAAAAWSFSENDSVQLHADYLIHDFSLLRPEGLSGRMPVYAGLGLRLKLKDNDDGPGRNVDDDLVGVRVPIGISYLFHESDVDIFAELVPVLDVAPDSDFDINAAIGARLYF